MSEIFGGDGYGISIDHEQKGNQMLFKRTSLLRTGLGVGVQIAAFFLLEIVVVIINTIGESFYHPTTTDDLDQERERSKTWKAYKEERYRE